MTFSRYDEFGKLASCIGKSGTQATQVLFEELCILFFITVGNAGRRNIAEPFITLMKTDKSHFS